MNPEQRATVYTLLERGTTRREIARITGNDRKAVRSYQRHREAERSNSSGLATGSEPVANPLCGPH